MNWITSLFFIILILITKIKNIKCRQKNKDLVPGGGGGYDEIVPYQDRKLERYEKGGKKLEIPNDPYEKVYDPTAGAVSDVELPSNEPNREIKKFLRKEAEREVRRKIRLKFYGRSRHPNTEKNVNTKRTEPDFTSVETMPDFVDIAARYTHLFIEK